LVRIHVTAINFTSLSIIASSAGIIEMDAIGDPRRIGPPPLNF
jgi:hypothetical protein